MRSEESSRRARQAAWWSAWIVAYSLLACALTWPLPRYLQTRLLGDPGGDTGAYIWNLWIFRHELLRHAHLPVSTQHVFAYSGGADFSLHNYAPLAGALGSLLIAPLGVVGAFNALMIFFTAVSGAATFVLARRLGLGRAAAFVAGALFMASPVLVAKETAHFSLVIAGALPLFLWALNRTLDGGRVRDAVLMGALVAAAHYSDPYYSVYCVLMGAFVVTWRFSHLEWPERMNPWPRLARGLDLLIGSVVALIAWRLLSGTQNLVLGSVRIGLATLYSPQLVLLVASGLRLWIAWRPRVRVNIAGQQLNALLRLAAVSSAACLVLLTPPLVGLARRVAEGRMPQTDIYWRSSPRGVDALAYFIPNPNHAWFGDWTRPLFMPPQADAFPEFVASFSLVALALVAAGAALRTLPRFWVAFTGFFIALSLGPFIHVAGINTYIIGPWAFLRYAPVIGMARSPSRFAIVAALGLCMLTAHSLETLWRRSRRARWAGLWLVVAFGVELIPAPRPLFSAAVPDVYRLVAAANGDEAGRLLELPTGIRDGTSSIGDFNASSEYFQTSHRRPLVGGYLSRVSMWRKQENERAPMLRALFALSEGRQLSREWIEAARASRDAFLRRSCVKLVIINKRRSSPDLNAFAIETLQLALVHEDATHALLTPADAPACESEPKDAVSTSQTDAAPPDAP